MASLTPQRTDRFCQDCGYDVGQTLADGFAICPECGVAISEETCHRREEDLPAGRQLATYASWLSFPASVVLAFVLPAPIALLLIAISAGVVYASWCRVEAWLGSARPGLSAIAPTLSLLMLLTWLMPVTVPLLLVYMVHIAVTHATAPREC